MSTPQPRAIISPSVLASNFADLGNEIRRMQKCGAEWVHMGKHSPRLRPDRPDPRPDDPPSQHCADVMDGHFVPNITMGPPVLESVHKTVENVFMDCHMMVAEPHKVRLSLACRITRSRDLTSSFNFAHPSVGQARR